MVSARSASFSRVLRRQATDEAVAFQPPGNEIHAVRAVDISAAEDDEHDCTGHDDDALNQHADDGRLFPGVRCTLLFPCHDQLPQKLRRSLCHVTFRIDKIDSACCGRTLLGSSFSFHTCFSFQTSGL